MTTASRSKLESFIFADLLATAMVAILAYGTVEPWSLALFELNALLIAVLLAVRFTFDAQADFGRWQMALPLLALSVWGTAQFAVPALSLDSQATKEATVKVLALAVYFLAGKRSGRWCIHLT